MAIILDFEETEILRFVSKSTMSLEKPRLLPLFRHQHRQLIHGGHPKSKLSVAYQAQVIAADT